MWWPRNKSWWPQWRQENVISVDSHLVLRASFEASRRCADVSCDVPVVLSPARGCYDRPEDVPPCVASSRNSLKTHGTTRKPSPEVAPTHVATIFLLWPWLQSRPRWHQDKTSKSVACCPLVSTVCRQDRQTDGRTDAISLRYVTLDYITRCASMRKRRMS